MANEPEGKKKNFKIQRKVAKRFPVVVKVASFQHPSTHNIRPKTCMSVIISHLEFWFYHMNSRSRLKGRGRDMDFLLVVVPSSHRETAVCSYRFVCNVVLCRLGWYVDRVIITGHCWTQVRNTKNLGLVSCYWVVYSAAGCGSDTGTERMR